MDPATAMMMFQAIQGALRSDPGQGQFNNLGYGYNAYTANTPMDRLSSMLKGAAGGFVEGKIGQLADESQLALLEKKLGIQTAADLNRLRQAIPIKADEIIATGRAGEAVQREAFPRMLERSLAEQEALGGLRTDQDVDRARRLAPVEQEAAVNRFNALADAEVAAGQRNLEGNLAMRKAESEQDIEMARRRFEALAPLEKRQAEEMAAMELRQGSERFRQKIEQEAMLAGVTPQAYLAAMREAEAERNRREREKAEADLEYTRARTRATQSQRPAWMDAIFGME